MTEEYNKAWRLAFTRSEETAVLGWSYGFETPRSNDFRKRWQQWSAATRESESLVSVGWPCPIATEPRPVLDTGLDLFKMIFPE